MAAEKIDSPWEIYQIKVTLLGTDPPIWRRLLVPADMTLKRLHDVLQAAMGWEDCHLHEFTIGKQRFGPPDPMAQFMGTPPPGDERTSRLSTVLGKARAKATYMYDFGDDWDHGIVVEKVLPREPGQVYPVCVDGERHGAPEDCGGVYGFYNLLEAIGDPKHEEHEAMRDWVGDDFDPEAFSVDEVNRRLAPLRPRKARAAKGTS